MTAREFKKTLADRISSEEAAALSSGAELCISDFNRAVCLRILEPGQCGEGSVSPEDADLLEKDLADYLNKYMQEKPEGHKWIILACLYLTFVERVPMHPQQAAKWVMNDGRYRCPSMAPDSITCRYCVCEEMTDDEKIDLFAARILRKYKPAFLELAKGDE
ncbi:MAG: hypothetical protein J5535_05235 [Firmicutes bacterium]|nr:hypothetical protein [Bacillota bacterium]